MSFFVVYSSVEKFSEVRIATRGHHRLEEKRIGGRVALEQVRAKRFENVNSAGIGPGSQEVCHLLNQHDIEGIEEEILLSLPAAVDGTGGDTGAPSDRCDTGLLDAALSEDLDC